MQATTSNATFVDLNGYEDTYQISTEWPYDIRKKHSRRINRILKQTLDKNGYTQVVLDGYYTRLDKLIAIQFLENDDPLHKTEVLHINLNTLDDHLDNLQWVTRSDYIKKRKLEEPYYLYEDLGDLDRIIKYNDYEFDDYYTLDGGGVFRRKANPDRYVLVLSNEHRNHNTTMTLYTKTTGSYETFNTSDLLWSMVIQQTNGVIRKLH